MGELTVGDFDHDHLISYSESGLELGGIDEALRQGHTIHGSRSGGGLRIVSIERDRQVRGYGEHPIVDKALEDAAEDFLAGGRPYEEVYGKLHTHFVTGTGDAHSPLDEWILHGHTFAARVNEQGKVIVELQGLKHSEIPQSVVDLVELSNGPIEWNDRGYTYLSSPSVLPNGDKSMSTRTIKTPEGKPPNRDFMYYIQKTGEGNGFAEAVDKAFEAPEIEIPDPIK